MNSKNRKRFVWCGHIGEKDKSISNYHQVCLWGLDMRFRFTYRDRGINKQFLSLPTVIVSAPVLSSKVV